MAELRTFVFTDLVGSVDLKGEMRGASDAERDAAFVADILSPHGERIVSFATDFGGRVVSTAGDGHFLVFGDVVSAARWSIAIEQSHLEAPLTTPAGTIAQVRISLHLGSPQIDPRDEHNFIGKAVDYTARLNDFSSGEQILVSNAARAILEDAGLNGVAFHSHGQRELKGIGQVEIHELLFDGRPSRETRRKPKADQPRDWTAHTATVLYAQLAPEEGGGGASGGSATLREKKLGNYELGELVGAGGMGDVFKARHSQFGRLRAVKVIKPHLVSSGQHEVVSRFYQEIKAIGGLEHPNIVVAIDSSTPNDQTHYLVMEYVDGVSASDLVDRFGPMSEANACEIARQAAVGLDYIDRQGMVHRDIKPSNLMVTTVESPHLSGILPAAGSTSATQPLIKILDLGLALLVGDDHERLTRLDHRAMGTAMYMSPEQWQTTSVDIRSDIYSLGCTLYHMLSGKPPFYDSDLRPEKAHEKGRIPPIRDRSIPKPLWSLLRKMLSKNRDERFDSPAKLAEALAPFAAGNTLTELVEEARRRPASEATQTGHAADTAAGDNGHSDTRLAGGRLSGEKIGSSLTATPAASRRWLLVAGAVAAVSVAVSIWFGVEAIRQRAGDLKKQQQLVAAQRDSFTSSAKLHASEVAREVDLRFRILLNLAETSALEQPVLAVANTPEDELLWEPLQSWIVEKKGKHDLDAPADSWFVVSAAGMQIARAPESKSIGKSYAHRDYFHGQGADLPKGSAGVKPITALNQSAVYRSTSTGKLKVAFSVPAWNDKLREKDREVVGVLAMSVDLGDFAVLDTKHNSSKEVLLIDLRPDYIEDKKKRGLILHHRSLQNRDAGAPLARLSPELLQQIDQALANNDPIIVDYADPLGQSSRHYWGAIERVVIKKRNQKPIDTQWLVIVQEPLPE